MLQFTVNKQHNCRLSSVIILIWIPCFSERKFSQRVPFSPKVNMVKNIQSKASRLSSFHKEIFKEH